MIWSQRKFYDDLIERHALEMYNGEEFQQPKNPLRNEKKG